MTFREILSKVIDQTPGALAGAVMAGDGIPVDEYEREPGKVDLAALAVEFQAVFEQSGKVAGSIYGGDEPLRELILVMGKHQVLFRQIDGEFFLIVALSADGLLGKARYLVGSMLRDLRETL